MKKFFFLAAIVAATIAQAQTVASFEDVTAGPQEGWIVGANKWQSGSYTFTTYKDMYMGNALYYAFMVSNETANTSTGMAEPYRSAKGGAHEGSNFAVLNIDYYGNNNITFTAQTIPGFFVTNTAYAVTSMSNGDSFAKKFTATDYFQLICTGMLNGVEQGSKPIDLAKEGKYMSEWTYVDLSELGEIDEVVFSMESSDNSGGWMNTPAYFALDDFGATKPENYVDPDMADLPIDATAINEATAEKQIRKVLLNGRLYIIREGQMYDVEGRVID